mgnify:CR=1 FL=1
MSTSYCEFAPTHPLHRAYHDHEYGFPLHDDNALFERLVLEINQAGLSWSTILNKRANFKRAYLGFDVATVAAFDDEERARLLADAGIIRNRLKINAAIENARRIQAIQREHGSSLQYLISGPKIFIQCICSHHAVDQYPPADLKATKACFRPMNKYNVSDLCRFQLNHYRCCFVGHLWVARSTGNPRK